MWQKLLQLQFAPNPGEVLAWMVKAGAEATVRAYGGDLRQGFAATRDGPRTITRWTGALRTAMNETSGHTNLFSALRHAAFTEDQGLLFVHAAVDRSRPLAAQGDAFWWGRDDILDLTAPFDGFGRVGQGHRTGNGAASSSVNSRYRSTAVVSAAGIVCSPPGFGATGAIVDRVEA